jgi:translation initiation factor 2 subunit 1
MVRKKNALPEIGEIVMASVVEVNPSHVYMILDDYRGTGKDGINREAWNMNEMIKENAIAYMHVSEIANYWIKNIREHIKEGQKHVVKVLKMDKGMVWVSKRRVSGQEAKQKLQEWKRSNKAEGLLRLLGEKVSASLDEIYEKMGFSLDEAYGGDLWSAFEDIREQGIAAIMDLDFVPNVDEAWLKELERIVNQNVEIPSVKIVGEFDLTSFEPNGVELIKEALLSGDTVKGPKEATAKLSFQVIAPPRYRMEVEAPDYLTAESLLKKVEAKVLKTIKKGGTGTFLRNK